MTKYKFPRIPHLPWSLGATNDDRVLATADHFEGQLVVVTEKMDGQCLSIYPDGSYHARSIDSKFHPSMSNIARIAPQIAPWLEKGWRIVGENLYARHSIYYSALPVSFMVIAIFDEQNRCVPWGATRLLVNTLAHTSEVPLVTVPELYVGPYDENKIRRLYTGSSCCGGPMEGYVVRTFDHFRYDEMAKHVAKFVRPNHVQTDKHWSKEPVVKNGCLSV